jgi:hypothetical protein
MIYHIPKDGWLATGWYVAGQEHLGPYETREEAQKYGDAHLTFTTTTGYDVAAIMRDAHRRTKKMIAAGNTTYAETFAFYLAQVWILAQHERRLALCTGAAVTVAKPFDNNNSPLWSTR